MEIEKDEYIRNNKGNIGKVIGIFDGHCNAKYHIEFQGNVKVKRQYLSIKTIVKHSKDITDLIEDTDILQVEISEEWVVKEDTIRFIVVGQTYEIQEIKEALENGIYKIRKILTHEQFEQNCYRLEE